MVYDAITHCCERFAHYWSRSQKPSDVGGRKTAFSNISLALALCLRDLDSKSMYAAIFSVHVKNT